MNAKKILAMLLTFMMLTAIFVPSVSALGDGSEITYESLPQLKEGYNRYYFMAPDDWFNEYTDTAGIYWWEGTDAQVSWPGVEAHKADADNVYYYDVSKDVTSFYWNNYIEYPSDLEITDHYYKTCKALIQIDSSEKYDGEVFVVDLSLTQDKESSGKAYFGNWYKYIGNGEYEISEVLSDADRNGVLSIKDETLIQKHVAEASDISDDALLLADFDNSGAVDIKDATAIQKSIVSA